MFRTKDT